MDPFEAAAQKGKVGQERNEQKKGKEEGRQKARRVYREDISRHAFLERQRVTRKCGRMKDGKNKEKRGWGSVKRGGWED